jgi:hypothetical protein
MVNLRGGMTEEQVRQMIAEELEKFTDTLPDMIANEVGRAFRDEIPGIFTGIRDQLNAMLEERLTAHTAGGGRPPREFTYREFSACGPQEFHGELDPIKAMRWIDNVEGAFRTCACPEEKKVIFSLNLLRGPANDWWKLQQAGMTAAQLAALTWAEFTDRVKRQYAPQVEIQRLTREFLELKQGETESVTAATIRFRELAVFCPQLITTEDAKMERCVHKLFVLIVFIFSRESNVYCNG